MVINGIVEQGKHLGRTLGFPTANVRPDEPCPPLPVNGVYAAAFWIAGDPRAHVCMLNQGVHPTVPEGKPTIEAHLLHYRGDLYGRRVRVEYLRFIRPERQFNGLEQLTDQLSRDRRAILEWFDDALHGADVPGSDRVRRIEWADS